MRKVRTTINPTTEIEVDAAEYADLKANGLLLDTRATTDAGLVRAAIAQNAERPHPATLSGELPDADDETPAATAPDDNEQDDDADSGENTEG